MGGVFILCYVFGQLSSVKAFGLWNLCYSKLSVVMLLGYRIAGISQNLESEQKENICPCAEMLHI